MFCNFTLFMLESAVSILFLAPILTFYTLKLLENFCQIHSLPILHASAAASATFSENPIKKKRKKKPSIFNQA